MSAVEAARERDPAGWMPGLLDSDSDSDYDDGCCSRQT